MINGQDIVYLSSVDWAFHWQGAQEIAVRLAEAGNRILYVETTGVRAPRFNDARRIGRRLLAWSQARLRTPAPVTRNLHVLSPLVLPPFGPPWQRSLNRLMITSQVRAALRRLGFKPKLIWTYLASDTVQDLISDLAGPDTRLVYYCATDFGLFASSPTRLATSEMSIVRRSDIVFTTCDQLAERLRQSSAEVHIFPCGVDFAAFRAGPNMSAPAGARALERLPRPIVGYIGGLHPAFDTALIVAAARSRPAWSWVFVGQPSRPLGDLPSLPNVHLVGQQPHAELPEYVRRFDVGVVPYVRGRLTDTVVPTKINEYLAAGKPVVATDLPNVVTFQRRYGVLEVAAAEPGTFVAAIERVLEDANDPVRIQQRQRVAAEADWSTRLEQMSVLVQQAMDDRGRLAATDRQGGVRPAKAAAGPNPGPEPS